MNNPLRRPTSMLRNCALAAGIWLGVIVVAVADDKPFYLTLDPPPAPELSPQDALASFTLATGYEVELVAAEPLVEDPVAITWDEQGRMYVVEMRGFMPDAYGKNEKDPVGYVVRLSDTNGDGSFDHREILLDKLVLPRAIAVVNDGLLVGEPPNLWLCPKTPHADKIDTDINCADKINLGSYGDQPGSVEHAENGLLLGLDNWLYSAKSNRRLQLQDGNLVVEPTLFRGQWGIAQDNDGRLFYNTNSNLLLGDFYDAQQTVAAGNSSAPGLGEQVSTNDQLFAVRVNPGVNRAYVPGVLRKDGRLNRPTSASGMTLYRGDQFSTAHSDDVFVAEPAANAVAQLRLQQDGLTISAEHVLYTHPKWGQVEFFASTDERFRPVDVNVGPDGALYVVDMYRGIIQDHVFLSDELRAQALARQLDKPVGMGRIWRIRATGDMASVSGPLRKTPNLAQASTNELVELLGHPNAWHRATAQRLLQARDGHSVEGRLTKAVRKGEALQAVHAIWTLAGRDALDRRTVRKALARSNIQISLSAIRAGSQQLSRKDLLRLARSKQDPVLAQQLTFALSGHNSHTDVQEYLLNALLANVADPYRPSAIRAAANQQELSLLQSLQTSGRWTAALEEQTHFVQSLVMQGFRNDPDSATPLLDFVQARTADERWLQVAVLDGLFDVSRGEGFERAELAAEHEVFGSSDQALWPSIARARRAITWPGDDLAADAKPLSPTQQAARTKGVEFYRSRCATCHGDDGQGIASLAPPLADSPWVTESSERLVRIMLHGLQGPIEVAGETWNGVMPGHGTQPDFTDEVASGLVTHLHRAWGHSGRAVNPEFIASIRQQTEARTSLWTVPELLTIDTNTHYQKYQGRFGSPAFALEFVYNGQGLDVKSGIFNGPLVEIKEDHFVFEPRQLKIEFVLDNQGVVTSLRMPTGDGESQLPRLQN